MKALVYAKMHGGRGYFRGSRWAQFSCNYGLESVQLQRPAGPELSQLTSIVVVAIYASCTHFRVIKMTFSTLRGEFLHRVFHSLPSIRLGTKPAHVPFYLMLCTSTVAQYLIFMYFPFFFLQFQILDFFSNLKCLQLQQCIHNN